MNNLNEELFEVEDHYKREFIIDLLFTTIPFILPIIVIITLVIIFYQEVNTFGFLLFFFVTITLLIMGYYTIKKYLNRNTPIYYVKCFITAKEIKILLQNQVYLKLLWFEIKKVDISNEKYFNSYKFKHNYVVKVTTERDSQDLRIFLLRFRKENMELIISKLKQFCTSFSIDFELNLHTENLPENTEIQLKELDRIKQFRENLKNSLITTKDN